MSDNFGTNDFRESASFLDELDDSEVVPSTARRRGVSKAVRASQPREKGLLGMQPGQAFIIAAMLFFLVCLVGAAVMVLTEKMVLPI